MRISSSSTTTAYLHQSLLAGCTSGTDLHRADPRVSAAGKEGRSGPGGAGRGDCAAHDAGAEEGGCVVDRVEGEGRCGVESAEVERGEQELGEREHVEEEEPAHAGERVWGTGGAVGAKSAPECDRC